MSSWGRPLHNGYCNNCGKSYLLTNIDQPILCTHCLGDFLEIVEDIDEDEVYPVPEAVLSFDAHPNKIRTMIDGFMASIPFKPSDLTVDNIIARWQKVYYPRWLVDTDVKAQWSAEVGFDYEVVSHQEYYKNGWNTREVREKRIRWEPRLGEIEKRFDNMVAPALEHDARFVYLVGDYTFATAPRYEPHLLDGTKIRVPERLTEDSWTDAQQYARDIALHQCADACEAQHMRGFKWSADFGEQHWTQLLLPAYVSYYIGPDGDYHWVIINGQTAKVSGEKRANVDAARRLSMLILAGGIAVTFVALFMLVLGVLVSLFWLVLLVGLGIILFVAPYPVGRAWLFNRAQVGKGVLESVGVNLPTSE